MSTINEVRAAEQKLRELVEALRRAGIGDHNDLCDRYRAASDEYAKAIRELPLRLPRAPGLILLFINDKSTQG